jgi:hypothetical protein
VVEPPVALTLKAGLTTPPFFDFLSEIT